MSHIRLRSELKKTEHLPSRVTVAEHLVEMEQYTVHCAAIARVLGKKVSQLTCIFHSHHVCVSFVN